jgi:murein DD-endopeptidase MepM/ murein hydrolase activator NlpD
MKRLTLIFFIFLFLVSGHGQTKSELETKRIGIQRTSEVITSLEEDTKILEKEYGALLRQALRQKLSDSYISFIFSSKDFNEALKRWRYMNQYRAYRARQAQIIRETKTSLLRKKETLKNLSVEKEKILAEQLFQQEQLSLESKRRNKMYQSLKSNEKKLRAELKDQQDVAFQLKSAILNLINGSPREMTTANSGDLNLDFQRAKTKLRRPLVDGIVVRFFGKQQHPTIKRIEIVNNGIDILGNGSTSVTAVFTGQVSGEFTLPNGKKSVLLKHGEYYTVYSNLEQVFVKKDEQIGTGQEIGQLSPTENTLHFELWRQKTRLNPADWLIPQ